MPEYMVIKLHLDKIDSDDTVVVVNLFESRENVLGHLVKICKEHDKPKNQSIDYDAILESGGVTFVGEDVSTYFTIHVMTDRNKYEVLETPELERYFRVHKIQSARKAKVGRVHELLEKLTQN